MAKSQTANKSTIGKDPFETLIPDRISEPAEVIQHPTAVRPQLPAAGSALEGENGKMTAVFQLDLANRIRNAAAAEQMTITEILAEGAILFLEKKERERGAPYPQRRAKVKTGRPTRS